MRPDHAPAVRQRLTDPAALCAALGLEISRTRRQHDGVYIRCPVHDDKSPSCSVRTGRDRGIACRCHACGWTGDALGLVAAARGLDVRLDFRRVLEEAAAIAGIDVRLTNTMVVDRRQPVPAVYKLARRIDALADDWLHGRTVRRDEALEAAPVSELAEAFDLLSEADAMRGERDCEMERLAGEYARRSGER